MKNLMNKGTEKKFGRRAIALMLLGLLVVFGSACSTKKASQSQGGAAAPILPGLIPGAPDYGDNDFDETTSEYQKGDTVRFTPVSAAAFNQWAAIAYFEPKDLRINVNLVQVNDRVTYAGEVRIRYIYNAKAYEAVLTTHHDSHDGNDYFKFNSWYVHQNKPAFSAFLEDRTGAIVLVIDGSNDLGDGGGSTELSGSIWFKNFTSSFASYYEGGSWSVVLPCWFRTRGPYACPSPSIMNKSSVIPDGGYEKLGTFTGLNKAKAFNLEEAK